MPAPPLRISSRGHVLHRPLAPRHPPCALRRLCLPTSSVFASRFVVRAARPITGQLPALADQVDPLHLSRYTKRLLSHPPGGAAGIRTPDLRRARAALSQTKLRPPVEHSRLTRTPVSGVGAPGLEPGTSALSGPRSNHLSYAPGQGAPNRPPAGLEINRFQHTHSPPRHAQQQPVPKTKQTRAAHVPTTPHHLSLCSQAPLPDPSSASHARPAPRLGPPRHTAHRSDA